MGRHLGDFGKPQEEGNTFGWFGATMRIGPIGELALLDFMERAAGIAADGDEALGQDPAKMMEAAGALFAFFRRFVVEEDFDEFWRLAVDNGQTVEDLMGLLRALTEAQSGFPTKPRSGSDGTRQTTGRRSTESASSRAARRLVAQGRPDLARAIPLQDRPRRTG